MDLHQLMQDLLIDATCSEDLQHRWQASVDSFTDGVFFLEAAYLRSAMSYCQIDEERQVRILETAAQINANNALQLFTWHAYQRLVFDLDGPSLLQWPNMDAYFNKSGGALYLIVMMGALKDVRAACEAKNIPEEIIHDTCYQFAAYCKVYEHGHDGEVGINIGSVNWSRHYVRGDLYRLGRMEFMLKPLPDHQHVFKHKTDGRVLMLLGHEQYMTDEGYYFIDGDDELKKWQSSLTFNEESYIGYPINPNGQAQLELVTLDAREWEYYLKPGDPVLDLHIPSGGGMTLEKCQDSFVRGFKFFDTYFKDLGSAKAVNCSSWIFNPDLEHILPGSNLAQLIAAGYCYPFPSSGRDGLRFIFGREYDDLDDYPQNTSLEKAFIQKLKNGERLRNGGWLILREHADKCAEQVYRSQ